ncbi:helix-turn-helix domain-containing protein [Paenibacillus sp. GCM10027628]|uniref:AraC family transcriptional regulator n=1 Tax=Paenibacillus sp. GCM10027628 TaxID=3273413 RepID=UPI00363AC34B
MNFLPDPQLPESLKTFKGFDEFQIFINRNEGEWRMPFEWHEPLEIFYVKSGRGKYYIDDKVYVFGPGDVFVIGNHELHKSQLIDREPFEVLVVMFDPRLARAVQLEDGVDPLELFYKRDIGFSHQLQTADGLQKKLNWCFELMHEEYGNTEGYSLRKMVALLQWLLLELSQAYSKNIPYLMLDQARNGVHFKEVVSRAMEYITAGYREDITLEKIAKHISVNPSYLSRVFKQNTGFTIVEFITFKRIWQAKEMLLYSNARITDIAYHIGYNNVTHFQWTFKKMLGISPNQYRKHPRNFYHLKKY